MPNTNNPDNRGGDRASHEQHVKSGEQSHKNQDANKQAGSSDQRGGSQEQHAKAGEQSHKNR
jgi:hypothetical protein